MKDWTARCVQTPLGLEVEVTLTDGALLYLHKDIAREFGNQLRGACDEIEVREKIRHSIPTCGGVRPGTGGF